MKEKVIAVFDVGKTNKRVILFNYDLKPIDDRIPERVYKKSGGQDEFCRRTASPALGMLNSSHKPVPDLGLNQW